MNTISSALPAGESGRRRLIQLLVAAQVLFVLAVAGAGYATSELGQRLQLRSAPIDPAELKTGSFVHLRYDIGTVALAAWHGAEAPRMRQKVYVLLHNTAPDSLARVAGVYAEAPTPAAGQVVLRGWINRLRAHTLGLRLGLERYYVPGGSPLRREKPGRLHPLQVSVSVAPWGQARIIDVQLVRTAPRPVATPTQP